MVHAIGSVLELSRNGAQNQSCRRAEEGASRRHMQNKPDVLILGAGVIGVCVAYFLSEKGYRPLVIDKDDVCAGSSYGNAGLIVPSHVTPLATPGVLRQAAQWLLDAESPLYIKPRLDLSLLDWTVRFLAAANESTVHRTIPILLELNRASLDLYQQLTVDPGVDCGFQRRGGLFLFNNRQEFAKAIAEIEGLRRYNIDSAILDAAAVQTMMPAASPAVVGGIYHPEDAHLIPDRFVLGLMQRARGLGAQLQSNTEVLGFETSNRRITRVLTTRGAFHPEQVVLATGAWSPNLARQLGFNLPIQPAKGYSITVERPEGFPELPLHFVESKVVLTPMGDRLRFAGTLELAGLDLSINARRVNAIRKAVRRYLTIDPDQGLVEIWRGLRPLAPDSRPIIGRSPRLDNLVLATGHGMVGVSLGPITGKLVAQVVSGDRPDFDLTPLHPDRFRTVVS